ncbi:MAG: membrane protein insertion efficiency factor YidD [Actinomycetota bacterium]|nr:membrane protein insertion efficiency factor YidD [Actinomycetota bacterium]
MALAPDLAPSDADPAHPSRASRVVVGLIRLYQLGRAGHVSPCRFTPTCSEFAAQALARHGVARGLGLTVRRLGRCHPFGSFGADPVPE